jgi:hypothetical protein
LTTVLMATPVNRLVERMERPSIRHRSTWARWAESSLFILTIMLDLGAVVNTGSSI